MNIPLLRFLVISSFLFSLSSCSKITYSKEKVEQSVIKLCKEEYNLDVAAKIIGSTLGVFIPIEGLVGPKLQLNKEAGEKIEDVALSIHRVTMSTDKPLKFYVLTARDTKTPGAEFILTGSVYDVLRVRLMDISRGEYYKRILRDFKFNSTISGKKSIEESIDALNKNLPGANQIKPSFYPIYAIGKNSTQKIEILDIIPKEISPQEALFHLKTIEYYEALPGFEIYMSVFPPGFRNEYLILVNTTTFPNTIKEIVTKYFYSADGIRERNLQETFDRYEDISYISIDGFPKKDIKLDWFLSQTITRRIKTEFEEDKKLKEKYTVESLQGVVVDKIFHFGFLISPKEGSSEDERIVFSKILNLTARVFHRYSFEDFEGLELIDSKPKGKKIYLSRIELEKFRKNKIKIEDILQGSLDIGP